MALPSDRSSSFALDRASLRRWGRSCAIIFLPVAVAALSRLQSGEAVDFHLVTAALASSAIDLLRRYVTDYSSDPVDSSSGDHAE